MANQPKIPLDIIAIPQKIQRSKLQKCSLSKLTKIHFIPPRFTVHFLWGTPVAFGETWVVPKFFNAKEIRKSFDNLPVRYENQRLLFRLHDIERIEAERVVEIVLEKQKRA